MSAEDEEIIAILQGEFLTDPEDTLPRLREAIDSFEEDPYESISQILKIAHGIKGSAQAVGFLGISELVHEMESALLTMKKKEVSGSHVSECKAAIEGCIIEVENYFELLNDDLSYAESNDAWKPSMSNLEKVTEALADKGAAPASAPPTPLEDEDDTADWGLKEEPTQPEPAPQVEAKVEVVAPPPSPAPEPEIDGSVETTESDDDWGLKQAEDEFVAKKKVEKTEEAPTEQASGDDDWGLEEAEKEFMAKKREKAETQPTPPSPASPPEPVAEEVVEEEPKVEEPVATQPVKEAAFDDSEDYEIPAAVDYKEFDVKPATTYEAQPTEPVEEEGPFDPDSWGMTAEEEAKLAEKKKQQLKLAEEPQEEAGDDGWDLKKDAEAEKPGATAKEETPAPVAEAPKAEAVKEAPVAAKPAQSIKKKAAATVKEEPVAQAKPVSSTTEKPVVKAKRKGLKAGKRREKRRMPSRDDDKRITAKDSHQYLLCEKKGQTYAIDVSVVREIIDARPLQPLPVEKEQVSGVMPFRGLVLPVLRMDKVFGKEEEMRAKKNCIIICEIGETTFGIGFDKAKQVITLRDSEIQDAVTPGTDEAKKIVKQMAKLEDTSVLFLDLDRLIAA